jgi:murein DD-endopeptidase MepM/ murein hydrolase activator NlpD
MRRLTYSPKVYAFVRTDKHARPLNISNFIVRGNVHRRTDAVSTAEIEIRNPDKVFTQIGDPVFRPMDPITIFMTRLANRPVQVFTGYLDTTPYLQLFPGTVTLTASCTLKRLLHTYWDPSLPYVFDGFLREYGWNVDPKTGQMFSDNLYDGPKLDRTGRSLNDGSFGALLYATMEHVGQWDTSSIYIEKLPDGIVAKVTDVYNKLAKQNKGLLDNIESLLGSLMGTSAMGGGGGPLADPTEDTQRGNKIGTAVTTAYGPPWDGVNGSGVTAGGTDLRDGKRRYIVAADVSVYPLGTKLYLDPNPYDYKGAFTVDDTGGWFKPGGPRAGGIDFYVAEGRDPQTGWGRQPVNVYKSDPRDKSDATRPQTGAAPSAHDRDAATATRVLPIAEGSGITYIYNYGENRGSHIHAGIDISCPVGTEIRAAHGGKVSYGEDPAGYGTYIDLVGNTVVTRYAHLSARKVPDGADVRAGDLIALSGNSGHTTGPHLHFEVRNSQGFGTTGTIDPKGWLAGADDPSGGTQGNTSTANGVGDNQNASAFAAYLNLPGTLDVAEAVGLAGQKSLLNDQPLLPFIQQLTDGSLRSFQSMPNGNFFAFFPDYFGNFNHRKPYWEIDDIEILDGGIDLTDEFLATHVYIVGDTNFDFQVDWLDRLQSGGVMDLESAFRSGFITRPTEGEMTHQAALGFLKKYGARPYKEELPMIRSPFFEAFLAYQRFMQLWAKQFATKFQFTFMPELYPGGIVGLKDHGVQCYVEEVVHTFDYESGFTTEAILSAPAAMKHMQGADVSGGMVRAFDVTHTSNPSQVVKPGSPNQVASDIAHDIGVVVGTLLP